MPFSRRQFLPLPPPPKRARAALNADLDTAQTIGNKAARRRRLAIPPDLVILPPQRADPHGVTSTLDGPTLPFSEASWILLRQT